MHSLDLNLLIALDALLDTRSVSAAAKRMHLSQPAMSRVLGRLRQATGDAILVRAGRTMVPSPRAQAMRAEVAELVLRARRVLASEEALDPAQVERTFSIRCHDALLPLFGAALLTRLRDEAPGVTLRFVAEGPDDDVAFRQGHIDLDIGASAPPGLYGEEVARDSLSVVARRNHPYARQRPTPERFARGAHVIVSRRGRTTDPLDAALAAAGLQRRVVAVVPNTLAALRMAQTCNTLSVMATRACEELARSMGLALRPLPFTRIETAVTQAWHPRFHEDAAHRWLRQLTRGVLQAL